MPRSHIEVETLLQRLEAVLREAGLWSTCSPSTEALLSTAPFACDSMPFEQWLQYIFIPKLRAMLKSNLTLANDMGLYPMGQECIVGQTQRKVVLPVLAQIDQLFKE